LTLNKYRLNVELSIACRPLDEPLALLEQPRYDFAVVRMIRERLHPCEIRRQATEADMKRIAEIPFAND
jgi:hypothetical protein